MELDTTSYWYLARDRALLTPETSDLPALVSSGDSEIETVTC